MRSFVRQLPSVSVICSGLVFVGLNIADAWLTKQLLAVGGVEANWWPELYAGNMLIKGLAALAVVLILIRFGKPKLLLWLNIGISIIVLMNGICFLAYLRGLYG